MSRREALEVTRGDEARPIQPRRFSIVLRKPLAARNDGGAPKSAFKSSEKTRASEANEKTRTKGVTFMAPDAPDTPAARAVAVTHRRARMRTRKGTGRSVAARTFSLVLREPRRLPSRETRRKERARARLGHLLPARRIRALGSRDGASGVAAASGGESDSVAPSLGDDADAATVEIEAGVVGHRGDAAPAPANAPPAFSAGEPHDELPDDGFGGGFDGYDDDGGFGGGFEDDGDFGGDEIGATPAHGAVGFGRMVDGGNDPMTGAGRVWKRKRRRGWAAAAAGTPQSSARAHGEAAEPGARGRGLAARPRGRERQAHLPEQPHAHAASAVLARRDEDDTRVHESLPTVAQMTHRTPNPAWPKHTPWHGGGAVIAVGASVNADSAERAQGGEEAGGGRCGWRTSRTSRTRARRGRHRGACAAAGPPRRPFWLLQEVRRGGKTKRLLLLPVFKCARTSSREKGVCYGRM